MKTNICLALLAVMVITACGKKSEKKEKAPVKVKTEVIKPSFDGAGQTYVGIVEESEATAVSFTSMGVVRRIFVNEGQTVGRGQLLAEMDPTTMSNGVTAAQATTSQAHDMVAQAEKRYLDAKKQFEREEIALQSERKRINVAGNQMDRDGDKVATGGDDAQVGTVECTLGYSHRTYCSQKPG